MQKIVRACAQQRGKRHVGGGRASKHVSKGRDDLESCGLREKDDNDENESSPEALLCVCMVITAHRALQE